MGNSISINVLNSLIQFWVGKNNWFGFGFVWFLFAFLLGVGWNLWFCSGVFLVGFISHSFKYSYFLIAILYCSCFSPNKSNLTVVTPVFACNTTYTCSSSFLPISNARTSAMTVAKRAILLGF